MMLSTSSETCIVLNYLHINYHRFRRDGKQILGLEARRSGNGGESIA